MVFAAVCATRKENTLAGINARAVIIGVVVYAEGKKSTNMGRSVEGVTGPVEFYFPLIVL